jgi:hypothetical protein
MPGGQSAAVDSASRRRGLTGKPVTESNLSLCAPARIPADLAASPSRPTCPSEPHPNDRSVAVVAAHARSSAVSVGAPASAHDGVGQAARTLWQEEVITDRYHFLV